MRVAVASILQETNTFSPLVCTLADFEAHGLFEGPAVAEGLRGTNTEAAGAIAALDDAGIEAVPLVRGWAMSSGRLSADTLDELSRRLVRQVDLAGPLDGLVLSLHGAMAAVGEDDGDLTLLRTAREPLAPSVPIGVCLDLHANVTQAFVDEADFVIGYHTYPHVDMAATGARTAQLLVGLLRGDVRPVTRIARRPMLLPAEAQGPDGPLGALRRLADSIEQSGALDASLFPVQPWLDVDGLGFSALVTTDGDPEAATTGAERLATAAWSARSSFAVDLWSPEDAVARARRSFRRPVLLSESADSPTAGAAADSPATVDLLLRHAGDLRSTTTLVDSAGVGACREAGEGALVTLAVGCSLDRRFHRPASLEGRVARIGRGTFPLTGPVFTGAQYSMGGWAVVEHDALSVLLTERPAPTFDPACYVHAGISPEEMDIVVVRSANLFRAGWSGMFSEALILDLPGASTPRLASLEFTRAPRPLHPLDEFP
jgi:microcystin degradation protein MlrC